MSRNVNNNGSRRLERYLQSEVPFSADLFQTGDPALAPIMCWEWFKYPTDDELRRQLDAVKRAGFGAVYILPMPKEFRPDTMVTELEGYLTKAYFRKVCAALQYADALGLKLWLYDEGGWPSGSACGQVAQKMPEHSTFLLNIDKDGTLRLQKQNGGRPDIYNETVAECFTRLTHHAYARALGGLSDKVEAVFTDEPAGFANAVNVRLLDEFEKKYGYKMEPYLTAMLFPEEADVAALKARQDYYSLLCERFCSVLDVYRCASHEHGWLLAGHLDRDHTADSNLTKGYGNTLRALKSLDIPGVDAIGGQIRSAGNITDGNAIAFYPRFASSAAVQNGTPLALSESFAVYGNALSGDEMRYILNYQLARGVNLFNFMTMPSTLEKWYAYSERPYFHPDIPGFFALDSLCKELERECVFMSAGTHVAETALFYPYSDILAGGKRGTRAIGAFRKAGEAMEADGVDFDIIDADTVLASPVENGLLIAGGAAYAKVSVPEGCEPDNAVSEKLRLLRGVARRYVQTSSRAFIHRTVKDADGDLHICVFNQSRETKTGTVLVNTRAPIYRCEPKTGEIFRFANGGQLTLAYGQCALLLVSEKELPCREKGGLFRELPVRPLSASKTAVFRLSESGARLQRVDEPLTLPGNSVVFPEDFCGEAAFTYSFFVDKPRGVELSFSSLGCFAEIFINSQRAGSICTAPYRLNIASGYLRAGENTVTLKVSNLAAGAYAGSEPPATYEEKYVGPYHTPALSFERGAPAGGFEGFLLEIPAN